MNPSDRDDAAAGCAARARELIVELDPLPLPGSGRTLERWAALADVAGEDLSVARLVEGHVDAVAILAELNGPALGPGLAGVWAARPDELVARRDVGGGAWRLTGRKPFCSGAGHLDHAVVAARAVDGPRLFRVDAAALPFEPGSWQPLGMAGTASATVSFDDVRVDTIDVIGGPHCYVRRPGFGHGGCGVAACWWGGARVLLADVAKVVGEHEDEDLAAAAYARAAVGVDHGRLVLRGAADAVDAEPGDVEVALLAAARTRFVVAEAARIVLDVAARRLGASVLGIDSAVTAHLADLTTYLTQHNDATAADLGRRLLARPDAGLR